MKRFYRRHRKVINVIAIVLVTALVMGIIATSTSLIAKVSNSNIGGFRERNPENLLDVESYEDLHGTSISGISFEVDEFGVITLNGKATADIDQSILSYAFPMPEKIDDTHYEIDYYYFNGFLDGSLDTYYFYMSVSGIPSIQTNAEVVCELRSSNTGYGYLRVAKGTVLDNVKIYPIISTEPGISYFK